MKISILGNGAWGCALAELSRRRGHHVSLWGRQTKPGQRGNLEEAVEGADLVVLAVPSHAMREICEKLKPLLSREPLLVSVAKGIEQKTELRVSQVISQVTGRQQIAVMSGPTFSSEVLRGFPSAIVVAARNQAWARAVQDAMSGEDFRVYTSEDVSGVEFGGALKNVMAIAAGACVGMGLGDNALAALITRGVAELSRVGTVLGGQSQTFFGLSGMGDLILTCSSSQSRNRRVGEGLGRGQSLDEVLKGLGGTAEGVKTASSVHAILQSRKIEAPILSEVYSVLYQEKPVEQALRALMGRELKKEF